MIDKTSPPLKIMSVVLILVLGWIFYLDIHDQILGAPELRIDHYGRFSGKLRFFMIQVAKHVGNA